MLGFLWLPKRDFVNNSSLILEVAAERAILRGAAYLEFSLVITVIPYFGAKAFICGSKVKYIPIFFI